MNKLDLIEALQNEADLTKSEAEAVVRLFINEMINALAKGDRCLTCFKNSIPSISDII